MRPKHRWLFEPPLPTIARKSKFTSAQIRQAILDAQQIAPSPPPPGTTIRTRRSEMARHRDSTAGIDKHHAFPKYLGGLNRQTLAHIPAALHYLYHKVVDEIIKLPRSSKGYRKLSHAERVAMLHKLQVHARNFDQQHGTNIFPLMQKAMREAKHQGLI
jgi:hypothetical protein